MRLAPSPQVRVCYNKRVPIEHQSPQTHREEETAPGRASKFPLELGVGGQERTQGSKRRGRGQWRLRAPPLIAGLSLSIIPKPAEAQSQPGSSTKMHFRPKNVLSRESIRGHVALLLSQTHLSVSPFPERNACTPDAWPLRMATHKLQISSSALSWGSAWAKRSPESVTDRASPGDPLWVRRINHQGISQGRVPVLGLGRGAQCQQGC